MSVRREGTLDRHGRHHQHHTDDRTAGRDRGVPRGRPALFVRRRPARRRRHEVGVLARRHRRPRRVRRQCVGVRRPGGGQPRQVVVDDAHHLQPPCRDRTRRRPCPRRGLQRELSVRRRRAPAVDLVRPVPRHLRAARRRVADPHRVCVHHADTVELVPGVDGHRRRPGSVRSTSTVRRRAVRSGPDAALRQGTRRRRPDRFRTRRRRPQS